jgi:hypothetical protein
VWLAVSAFSDVLDTDRSLHRTFATVAALVGVLLWLLAPARTLKRCPKCKERIPMAGRRCRSCGHDLRKYKSA